MGPSLFRRVSSTRTKGGVASWSEIREARFSIDVFPCPTRRARGESR